MIHFIEFIGNHPALISLLVVLISFLTYTESKKGGKTISSQQLSSLVNHHQAVLLDIREKAEFNSGHIVNSIHISHTKIKDRISELEKYQNRPIIIIDAKGQHAGTVGKQIKNLKIDQVMRLKGGILTWLNDGLPLIKA